MASMISDVEISLGNLPWESSREELAPGPITMADGDGELKIGGRVFPPWWVHGEVHMEWLSVRYWFIAWWFVLLVYLVIWLGAFALWRARSRRRLSKVGLPEESSGGTTGGV